MRRPPPVLSRVVPTVADEATGLGQTSSNSCLSLFALFHFKYIKRQVFAKRDANQFRPKSLVTLQLDLGPENILRCVIPQLETQLTAEALHHVVFWKNIAEDPLEAFSATNRE